MTRRHFSNPWPHEEHGFLDIIKWKFNIGYVEQPELPDSPNDPAPSILLPREIIAQAPASGWRIAWLGHASFLVQGCGISILIDPVFADYCSPFPMKSLMRQSPLPCSLEDLPPIDFILLTHSHYDHLDMATLRTFEERTQIVIAEGHSEWLAGKLGRPVSEVAWHSSFQLTPDVKITATPAQHFTARTPFDRNRGHWCGWVIEGGGNKLWHAGDSGYCPAFRKIGERYGPIDFGMIPIGAYQPRRIMKPMHMNAEEAVQAFEDARCQQAAGMHWGTFVLTDEPMSEPPIRLRREIERRGINPDRFTARPIGTVWDIG
jgi:N-acyl-phosphatidylethanolamine-hydrolysing phospholipase D